MSTTAKNPAAVALGRLGGLKGGKAKITSEEGIASAREAVLAHWAKPMITLLVERHEGPRVAIAAFHSDLS